MVTPLSREIQKGATWTPSYRQQQCKAASAPLQAAPGMEDTGMGRLIPPSKVTVTAGALQ